MRKITQSVASAFVAGVAKSNGNTRTDGQTLFLHGHPIARKVAEFPSSTLGRCALQISWAGWSTSTTRERINGVLSLWNAPVRVCLQDFTPHVRSIKGEDRKAQPMDSREWFTVPAV